MSTKGTQGGDEWWDGSKMSGSPAPKPARAQQPPPYVGRRGSEPQPAAARHGAGAAQPGCRADAAAAAVETTGAAEIL